MIGNEAIAEAAIQAGCRYYFGYPITPQNELIAYMAKRMPEVGGTCIQAESEVSAINMVFGAAAAGARAMTSSSSPGMSLKQEGISYLAGCELPAVIVNIMRGGPGLGNIAPSQSDYLQATKGGGHGDYRVIVLAPSTLQEAVEHVFLAFDLADKYRTPVIILGDGILGQMIEPVSFEISNQQSAISKEKDWILNGCKQREPRMIRSLLLEEGGLEKHNLKLQAKFEEIKKEALFEEISISETKIILVAFGTCGRIVKSVVYQAREDGLRVGLIRPITLWPFPSSVFKKIAPKTRAFLVVEMNYGQMLEDVRLAINGETPVYFLGRGGGGIPRPDEIYEKVKEINKELTE